MFPISMANRLLSFLLFKSRRLGKSIRKHTTKQLTIFVLSAALPSRSIRKHITNYRTRTTTRRKPAPGKGWDRDGNGEGLGRVLRYPPPPWPLHNSENPPLPSENSANFFFFHISGSRAIPVSNKALAALFEKARNLISQGYYRSQHKKSYINSMRLSSILIAISAFI